MSTNIFPKTQWGGYPPTPLAYDWYNLQAFSWICAPLNSNPMPLDPRKKHNY